MTSEEETDGGAEHAGFSVDVDWLFSGTFSIMVGLMAVVSIGQVFPDYWLTIFLWGIAAAHTIQRSVSVEFEDGREKLVFSWPWGDTESGE